MVSNASGVSTDSPELQRLKERLQAFRKLRDKRDNTKDEAERAQLDYKRAEFEIVEMMQEAGVTNLKIKGLGQFILQTRMFVKMKDLRSVMKWAAEAGLLKDVQLLEDGRIMVPFDQVEDIDPETGVKSIALINGILKARPYAKPISDHVKAVLDETDVMPEGVDLSPSAWILVRK